MDEFEFALDAGQGFGDESIVTALLQQGTRIFSKDGDELDASEIRPDTAAKIDGVFAVDELGTFYKTALLLLDLNISAQTLVRGTVVSLDAADRTLVVDAGETNECIEVPEDADIFLIEGDDAGGSSSESGFSDLSEGLRADIYGQFEAVGGCFIAETVIAFPSDSCDDENDCPVEGIEAL